MNTPRQRIRSRLLWFAVGAALNYILISTPFRWLVTHTDWPVWAISASSVGLATCLLFAWNYLVNFRSASPAGTALTRYLTVVITLWLLSSLMLTSLKHVDLRLDLTLGIPLDLDVIGTQCFLAGLKFALYHKWVFPSAEDASRTA